MKTNSELNRVMASQTPVVIYDTTETGQLLWAVAPHDDQELWLNAFKSLKAAQDFCETHKLPIREESNES